MTVAGGAAAAAPRGDEPPESGRGTRRAAVDPTRGRRRRRVTGGSGGAAAQLNVPSPWTAGAPIGIPEGMADIPPSQQGAAVGIPPQGSQTGPQGAAIGGGQSPPPQGERNSMNDGRRQLLPMQLLQPGAAARAARASARHPNRTMTRLSEGSAGRRAGGDGDEGRDVASIATPRKQ
jgi:hypothetical protein